MPVTYYKFIAIIFDCIELTADIVDCKADDYPKTVEAKLACYDCIYGIKVFPRLVIMLGLLD